MAAVNFVSYLSARPGALGVRWQEGRSCEMLVSTGPDLFTSDCSACSTDYSIGSENPGVSLGTTVFFLKLGVDLDRSQDAETTACSPIFRPGILFLPLDITSKLASSGSFSLNCL